MTICFDTDGCLINKDGKGITPMMELLKALAKGDNYIVVWSGNGVSHVQEVVKKLKLAGYVNAMMDKHDGFHPDLVIDDKKVSLGKMNVQLIGVV